MLRDMLRAPSQVVLWDGSGWYWIVLDSIGRLDEKDFLKLHYVVLDGIAWYWMVLLDSVLTAIYCFLNND